MLHTLKHALMPLYEAFEDTYVHLLWVLWRARRNHFGQPASNFGLEVFRVLIMLLGFFVFGLFVDMTWPYPAEAIEKINFVGFRLSRPPGQLIGETLSFLITALPLFTAVITFVVAQSRESFLAMHLLDNPRVRSLAIWFPGTVIYGVLLHVALVPSSDQDWLASSYLYFGCLVHTVYLAWRFVAQQIRRTNLPRDIENCLEGIDRWSRYLSTPTIIRRGLVLQAIEVYVEGAFQAIDTFPRLNMDTKFTESYGRFHEPLSKYVMALIGAAGRATKKGEMVVMAAECIAGIGRQLADSADQWERAASNLTENPGGFSEIAAQQGATEQGKDDVLGAQVKVLGGVAEDLLKIREHRRTGREIKRILRHLDNVVDSVKTVAREIHALLYEYEVDLHEGQRRWNLQVRNLRQIANALADTATALETNASEVQRVAGDPLVYGARFLMNKYAVHIGIQADRQMHETEEATSVAIGQLTLLGGQDPRAFTAGLTGLSRLAEAHVQKKRYDLLRHFLTKLTVDSPLPENTAARLALIRFLQTLLLAAVESEDRAAINEILYGLRDLADRCKKDPEAHQHIFEVLVGVGVRTLEHSYHVSCASLVKNIVATFSPISVLNSVVKILNGLIATQTVFYLSCGDHEMKDRISDLGAPLQFHNPVLAKYYALKFAVIWYAQQKYALKQQITHHPDLTEAIFPWEELKGIGATTQLGYLLSKIEAGRYPLLFLKERPFMEELRMDFNVLPPVRKYDSSSWQPSQQH